MFVWAEHVPVAQVVKPHVVAPALNLYRLFEPSVGTVTVKEHEGVVVTEWLLPSPATVVGETEQPLNVNVPAGARPTFKSLDSKTTWTIKAVIAIEGRPDVTSPTLELQVTPPSAAPVIKEKEIVREVVMIPCKYCGALMPQTETACPNCGAKRTA